MSQIARIDPRAPRFSQAITATLTLGGVALGEPLLIAFVALSSERPSFRAGGSISMDSSGNAR